jgi:magnesium chelatase subunit D
MVVVTDGRATSGGVRPVETARNAAAYVGTLGVASVVVDAEEGMIRLGLAAVIAERMGALALSLEELDAGSVSGVVRALTARRVA